MNGHDFDFFHFKQPGKEICWILGDDDQVIIKKKIQFKKNLVMLKCKRKT